MEVTTIILAVLVVLLVLWNAQLERSMNRLEQKVNDTAISVSNLIKKISDKL